MGLPLSAGAQVLAVEFIEARAAQAQFLRGSPRTELFPAMAVQKVTDERGGETFNQLWFFIAARMSEKDGFFAEKLAPAGHAGPP